MLRRNLFFGLLVAGFLGRLTAADVAPPPIVPFSDAHLLAGTWDLDPARSTQLSGWNALRLVITVDGPRVTLARQYIAGRRSFDDMMSLDLSKTGNVVPMEGWPDNRYIGAYMGGDKMKKVRFRMFADGRLLRTSSDITLATQQGEHFVNVLRDYRLSTNGEQLTVIELRSTRTDPIVQIFKRVTSATPLPSGNAE